MTDDKELRKGLIRLAYEKPELRETLLPLVSPQKQAHDKEARGTYIGWLEQAMSRGNAKLKHDGKSMRLYTPTDAMGGIYLIEVPTKPLKSKKMNVAVMTPSRGQGMPGESAFLAVNILSDAKIAKSDTYDSALRKLQKALLKAQKEFEKSLEAAGVTGDQSYVYPHLSQEQVHFLQIAPSDAKPFTAKAKGFSVALSWNEWVATHYDEENGAQSGDPSYTRYTSSSSKDARKLFKMLKAQPDLLKKVGQHDFSKWLDQNKLKYKMSFSVWR